MNYSVVHVNKMMYENKEVVKFEFSYSEELVKLIRNLPGARWSSFYKMWYIEKRAGLLNEVMNCFKGKAYLDYKAVKNEALLTASPIDSSSESKSNVINETIINSIYLNNRANTPTKIQPKKQNSKVKQYSLFI